MLTLKHHASAIRHSEVGTALLTSAAIAIAVLGVFMLWAGPVNGLARASTDTVQYATQTYRFAGYSRDSAVQHAVGLVCDDKASYTNLPHDACARDSFGVLGFPGPYQRIFAARPGYPAFSSLFVRAFGDAGMYVAVVVLQVATGVLLVMAARALGMRGWWPLAAEAAYFVLPAAQAGTRLLSEAAVAPGIATVLYGLALLTTKSPRRSQWKSTWRSTWPAMAVLMAALAWLFAVRAADALPLAALLAASGAVATVRKLPWGKPLMMMSAIAAAVMVVINTAVSWPSLRDGVLDLTTNHFTQPTPPDMYSQFFHKETVFWQSFAKQISSGSLLIVVAVVGVVGVVRAGRRTGSGLALLAVCMVGILSLAIHPGDWTRMLEPLWIAASLGLALLAMELCPGPRSRPGPTHDDNQLMRSRPGRPRSPHRPAAADLPCVPFQL